LTKLHDTLLLYPGPSAVFLHLSIPNRDETIIELPDQLRVSSTPALLEAVEQLFGDRITLST